ncbi:putative virulence factor [Vreelandella jeotgali]|uniref:putative virulence factor n=1 Tax=Vreelandella jeotgali TaxID=553386 RepID=UPI00034D6AA4|nr:virulence factor SrfC family protein [Halomonas jeotgali]
MSQLTPEQTHLQQRWLALHQGAGEAISWIDDVRHLSPRIDSEADSLKMDLYRKRNLATSLSHVATTPMTVGFFGLSQAGKSYLVSALAAGDNGALETRYSGQHLDFLEDINPVGGGKEATGLVTRFSRAVPSGEGDFPVTLKLFSEVDIVKVLANAWFEDFDHKRGTPADIRTQDIEQHLNAFARTSGERQSGMTPEDIVDLQDYLNDSFPKPVAALAAHYWPRVIELAPGLDVRQRGELLSILWGKQPEFTRLYVSLASTLGQLGHTTDVQAPLTSLVAGEHSQQPHRSIINVDTLEHLEQPDDTCLTVCPVHQQGPGEPVEMMLAQLTALTAELVVPLTEAARNHQVEDIDFLDFPGYRGRLNLTEIGEPGSQNGIAQLFLRGKVAYLFERYTDTQQMNGLVVCTSSEKQSDVSSVGPVLNRWIRKTQGATAEERGARTPGLIWALTMLDKRISTSLDHTPAQLEEGFEGMIKMTLLERFESYDWLQQWAPDQAFNNTFLVRKPHMKAPFLDIREGREHAFASEAADSLDAMKRAFIDSPGVGRHVHRPADAWDAMLTLGDGGMARISAHLERIAGLDYKLARINDQLEHSLATLVTHGLGRWYHEDGDGEQEAKRRLAEDFIQRLQTPALSELLHYMALPETTVRELYLSDNESADHSTPEEESAPATQAPQNLYGSGMSGGFFSGQPGGQNSRPAPTPGAKTAVQEGADHRFARAVFHRWVDHMRTLPRREALLAMLGLDQHTVENLCDELITGANRLKIDEKLQQALLQRVQSGARRERLVDRQVLTAQLILNDFIAWLDLQERSMDQRPHNTANGGQPLFGYEQDGIAPGAEPQLPQHPTNQAIRYLGDWLLGICDMTRENAGHSGGRELSVAQNARLGGILDTLTAKELING